MALAWAEHGDQFAARRAEAVALAGSDAEALYARYADRIGPRRKGTIYRSHSGIVYEVLEVRFGDAAREVLPYSEWALMVRELHSGFEFPIRYVWTAQDHVLRQPVDEDAKADAVEAAGALVANVLGGTVVSA
ncbi:hypothetical protein [Streptomyces ipomoeae]|uniref:hypothetical protein n=1 Tax=Streptomyces ipomoeae TaxID=103232 RepID=UPI001147A072|nr:hypothetical protein [Streptomyces ipomoeae]TQE33190.1 hypothetical protein Sipo7851_22120 [Streptomyces ipomoeae]